MFFTMKSTEFHKDHKSVNSANFRINQFEIGQKECVMANDLRNVAIIRNELDRKIKNLYVHLREVCGGEEAGDKDEESTYDSINEKLTVELIEAYKNLEQPLAQLSKK